MKTLNNALKPAYNVQNTPVGSEEEKICLEYGESLVEGDIRPIIIEDYDPDEENNEEK